MSTLPTTRRCPCARRGVLLLYRPLDGEDLRGIRLQKVNRMENLYWLVPLIGVMGLALIFWRIGRGTKAHVPLEQARAQFQQERSRLDALFLQTAGQSGKPRGLRWKECQWNE